MAAQTITFDEGMAGAVILVHLVAGDDHDALQISCSPAGLQHVGGAHEVGAIGAQGIAIRLSDQGLRGHVYHDVRRRFGDDLAHAVRVADVADDGARAVADHIPQIRVARRSQGVAGDLGAQDSQPQLHPRALEPRMPGEQNFAISPEFGGAAIVLHDPNLGTAARASTIAKR